MAVIRIYNYNNYYNRQLKKEDTLAAYGSPIYVQTDVNFNPGDGVATTLVIGKPGNPYTGLGDYLIAEEDEEFSRWFILETNRTRKGQYTVSLYRDVIADNYDAVLSADMFIEKATLPQTSPLIFNKENIEVNQIKRSETKLKDSSGCPWIVGYLDRKYEGGTLELATVSVVPDLEVASISTWEYFKYTTAATVPQFVYGENAKDQIVMECKSPDRESYLKYIDFEYSSTSATPTLFPKTTFEVDPYFVNTLAKYKDEMTAAFKKYKNLYRTITTNQATFDDILQLNGKILHDQATDSYYKISTIQDLDEIYASITSDKQENYLFSYFNDKLGASSTVHPAYAMSSTYPTLQIKLQKVTGLNATHKVTIPGPANRLHCKDAPFDMFCIPYYDGAIKNSSSDTFGTIQGDLLLFLSLAQSIAQQLSTNLYDLQLLPYAPITGYSKTSEGLDLKADNAARLTIVTDSANKNVMPILWSTSISNSVTSTSVFATSAEYDKKIRNETEIYRLVSPNYNATFEFQPAKLDSDFTYFNIDFTYLPYQPFIRIAPVFSGLYGKEFHDARGLILSGDFSLMYTSDAWKNYQIQNKNYQQIFNREIQSMNFQNSVQNQNQLFSAVAGSISGGVSGVMAGSIGGPWGAAAGALAGTTASAIGGIADIKNMKALQEEAINYKKDLFGYQLGNIKALPNSIAKSTAYNVVNKLFPVLEIYTCTEEERRAVANKIAFNGMTVMTIGKMSEYLGNAWNYKDIKSKGYIKGQLIRIDLDNDYHMTSTIAEELNKGVYTS